LNISQILSVLAVEEHKNFSHAADSLFLSQPALSLQISKLEAELGYSLFLRHPQGVSLTEEGKTFCEMAKPVVDAWNRLLKTSLVLGNRSLLHIRIGMGPRVFSNNLFEHILSFFLQNPEIEPVYITETGMDFWEKLKNGTMDIVLDRLPPAETAYDRNVFSVTRLITEDQCVICSENHFYAKQNSIHFSMLESCTLITGIENSLEDRAVREIFHLHDVKPGSIFRAEGMNPILALVRSGKGVTLGPRSFEKYDGIRAIPLEPRYQVSLCFICLKEHEKSPELGLLRHYLCDLCH
jgi:DNA-binding transcriptional LysR family regulator